ncbi:Sulfatase-modifying factor 2 [Durusdinium trenchii]|uniref:Sulfatase-modifying factor 2 n=1 Tax=Durusdinium trenchii TaxID=1381693 RepID=A0ABP0I247_9DINO
MEPVDSDSEPSEGARRFGEDVAHRLNATRTPFVTGILVEVAFASLMTRWMAESTREKSPLFNVSEEFIVQALWTVFGISVLGRCLCLLYSHRAILHRRSGRVVTILYMFCGTTQWLFNLSEACDFGVSSNCSLPYVPQHHYVVGDCVSSIEVQGQACCISETLKMGNPRMLVGWVLRHGYFAGGVGSTEFTHDSWLDILDAVVFSENLLEPYVRGPAYGISSLGRPELRNVWRFHAVQLGGSGGWMGYATFVVAFLSSIWSCLIYTALVPVKEEEALLDAELAEFQSTEDGHHVMVQQELFEEDEDGRSYACRDLLCSGPVFRVGRAVCAQKGAYKVHFLDDMEPEEGIFQLHELLPDLSKDEELGPCCSGWLHLEEFRQGRNSFERFERRARVIDAGRSLLCLQLPFLLWRLFLNSFQLDFLSWGGRTMLIGKNFIWSLMALTKILSCGRAEAGSTQLSQIWIGPSGILAFMLEAAGRMRAKQLEHEESKLKDHLNWLKKQQYADEEVHSRLQELQRHLVVIEEKKQFTFP